MPLSIFLITMLFLASTECMGQRQVKEVSKVSRALAQRLYFSALGDSADVILAFKNSALTDAKKVGFRVLYTYGNVATVRIRVKNLTPVLRDNNTIFADLVKKPKEELTTGALDLAVNKLNVAHYRFPDITGNGILASIKEQQFDSTDIDYINRYVNTGAGAATFTTHAAIMATTLAGGANTSPFAKGAAPNAFVTSTSFASLLPESDSYYQLFKIPIQNHSYGTAVEDYYGAEAAAYDESVVHNPTLVHVFSAGNSGTAAGGGLYSSLTGWSNLTGNFKAAKNVVVVGAIDSFYNVAAASSKGPTFDGRIKPDLVAFGEDGSSGAAAITSGAVALLQQAYANTHQHLPTASLVKAVLLNSADDVAQKGPDFTSGYGSLNGYNALQTMLQQHFLEDSVSYGDLKKFTITVPPNTANLKITLAWTDAPAVVNAAQALVNDLDLQVKNNSGITWLPWVLNAAAHNDSLTKEAKRQRDTINNVEQVSIAAPQSGIYTIEIQGSRIAANTQPFAVAYQFDTVDHFDWMFPTRNDAIIAAQTAVLRWQTTLAGNGLLEYTTNGTLWQPMPDTVTLAKGYYKWTVPDTLTTAQLRMRVSNTAYVVSDTFVISKPVNITVGFNCADSALLYWNALPVTQYTVYNLGARYLQPATNVADTAYVFKTQHYPNPYFSIAPVVNGREGIKSYAVNYISGGVGCYIRSFYVQVQQESSASFTLLIGTAYNIESIALQKLAGRDYSTLQTIKTPSGLAFAFSDTALKQGVNAYRVQLRLKGGGIVYSDVVTIYHVAKGAVLLYPNPAPQHTPVTLITNKAGQVHIAVFDAAGRLMQQQTIPDLINKITLSGFAKGIYLVRIREDDGTHSTQKLLVY